MSTGDTEPLGGLAGRGSGQRGDVETPAPGLVVAEDEDGNLLIRTPTGQVVPEPPLNEPLGTPGRPYTRPALAEPAPRWVAVLMGGCAVALVPWIVLLGITLPERQESPHWNVAWVGFDVALLAAMGLTALFAWRRSTWVQVSAAAAATLLVSDAWFDVLTSRRGHDRMLAIGSAVLLEVPLAALCLWVARHANAVAERATRLLLWRSSRQAARLAELQQEAGQR